MGRSTPLALLFLAGCATATTADSSPTVLSARDLSREAELAPKVAAFLDAFANYAPLLTQDGRVVFLSTRGTVPSLYIADAKSPESPAAKLATPDDRVAAISLLPDDKGVLFISDLRSDGNFRIFRTGLDGGGLTNLTPDEVLHRDGPVLAAKKPGWFAYSAHASTERAARVFVQSADGGAPKQVYRDELGGFVFDFSPDGSSILFLQEFSDDAQILFEIDVASGGAKRLQPAEGTSARIKNAGYSPDGGTVLFVIERDGQPSRLVGVDRASGAELAHYDETAVENGSMVDFAVSPANDRVAIKVDAGNRSELRLLDLKTLALVSTVNTGLGASNIAGFRADGAALAIAFTGAGGPTDIFSVDTQSGAVTPLRSEVRPGLAEMAKPKSSIEVITSFDGIKVPVNLYLPSDRTGKLPTYVMIHGGPSGSAYLTWRPTIGFFTAMGFAVVEPNIRGSTGFGIEYQRADDKEKRGGALEDVGAVNRWAREQPWCDGDRIVIGGISYGGYMTLLALGRQPKLWRAGINASGMSDLRTMERLEDQVVRAYDEIEFGVLGKEDDLLWEWSPMKYVDQISAPLFVYQGVNDPVSPQNEADQIVRAVRARDLDVEYMLLADEGHGVVRRENVISYLARTYRFLADHLGLP